MNYNLLLLAAALSSYAEEVKAEEAKKEKQVTIVEKKLGVYKQQVIDTYESENPDLTTFILTSFLRGCEKEDILNYVNVNHEAAINDKELYNAQHDFSKNRSTIWIHSAFEAKSSYRGGEKGAIKNLDEALGLDLNRKDSNDPSLYDHIHLGTIEDECSHCNLLLFYGPVDRKATAHVYCDTFIDLDDRKKEELVEKTAQKVAAEKQQVKTIQDQTAK